MVDISDKQPKEEKSVNVTAKALAPQLGSANSILMDQNIDERKFATLNAAIQTSLGYFKFLGEDEDNDFWRHIVDWELVTSQALEGKRARQVLQAIQAEAGSKSLETAERPNVFARNLWKRNWKKEAIDEGKVPVE